MISRKEQILTQERLKEVVTYDPNTGVFVWKNARGSQRAGAVAGGMTVDGHWRIKIDRNLYFAHRLAWLYAYGFFPDCEIDHKNCVASDNRLDNLRQATHSENNWNRPAYRNNRLGIKGVRRYSDNRFTAQIKVNGRKLNLGYFADAESASQAYQKAAEKYFGEFARHSSLENSADPHP
jgi:hypothetical protein